MASEDITQDMVPAIKERAPKPGSYEDNFLQILKQSKECIDTYGENEEGNMNYKMDQEGAAEDCYWVTDTLLDFLKHHEGAILRLMRDLDNEES